MVVVVVVVVVVLLLLEEERSATPHREERGEEKKARGLGREGFHHSSRVFSRRSPRPSAVFFLLVSNFSLFHS